MSKKEDGVRRVKDHPFFGMKSDAKESPLVELDKIRGLRIKKYRGKLKWDGDLDEMRRD
jgi:hypothetical protein